MTIDSSKFSVGDEWVYRLRDDAPSEPVRIRNIEQKKRSVRVDVEFLHDGHVENIPGNRLRVPWRDVAAFDQLMADWQRLDDFELDDIEQSAVDQVFEELILEEIAEVEWSPVRYATVIRDSDALSRILNAAVEEVTAKAPSFQLDGNLYISPGGTLLLAEVACRSNPAAVLQSVIDEERQLRYKCKRGSQREDLSTRDTVDTSPEWEYSWYLKRERPRHELLRQWCGHRAVTFHERLLAAESENQRLDILLARAIDALKPDQEILAEALEREHEQERITPEKARPIIDRPLDPSEIPVREVPARRRRW